MKHEISVKCPECPRRGKGPDRKKHLNINPARGLAHCFRCGFGTRNAEAYVQKENIKLPAGVTWSRVPLAAKPTSPSIRLPNEYTQDFTRGTLFGPQALHYLLTRHISRSLIAAYEIGHCPTGRFHHRILVPIYEGGQRTSFQARDWTDAQEVKYRDPDGAPPFAMFNLDRAAKTGVVLLVEGIFDALRVPEYGVAILGKGWSQEKRAKVLQARPEIVYVCLDRDARVENDKIHEDLGGCVPIVQTLEVDAKDLGAASAREAKRIHGICEVAARAVALSKGEAA